MKTKLIFKKAIAFLTVIILVLSAISTSAIVFAEDTSTEDFYMANDCSLITSITSSNKTAFQPSIISDVSPDGDAYALTSTASAGAGVVYFDFPGIDTEKAKVMDALCMWVKVPYDKTYPLWPNFNSEGWRFNGTITAYDTFKHTTTIATGKAGITLPAGFEGYVVLDLKNGKVENTWGTTPSYTWSEFVSAKGLSSLAPWTEHAALNGRTVVFDSFAFVSESYVENIESTYSSKLVVRDGYTNSGWYNAGQLTITSAIDNILKNKYVYQVDVIGTASGWFSVPLNKNLEETSFSAEDLKTLSCFVKVPDNISSFSMLPREYADNPWHNYGFGTGYCNLIDINKETVSRVKATDGSVTFPAGFEGYVVYDLTTFDNLTQALSYNLRGLQFVTNYDAKLFGMTWYYGDVAVWKESAESVVNRYNDYILVDDGTSEASLKGWFTNAPDSTAQIVNDASPDKSCYSYTYAETKGITYINLYGLNSIQPELIKSQKAIAMWVDYNGEKNFVAYPRYNGTEHLAIASNITTVNTKTGEIITKENTAELSLTKGFRGYVIFELDNATIDHIWSATDTPTNIDDYMVTTALNHINLYIPKGAMDNSTLCLDNIAYTTNTDKLFSRITSEYPQGDANEDGATDVKDLVRMKKYLAQQTDDINYFSANLSEETAIDSLDISALRKLLISFGA